MQLEIVIRVPLAAEGLSGVGMSVEPQAAATNGRNGGSAPELSGAGTAILHEPPLLAELGIAPEPPAVDPGPPPIEMLERVTEAAAGPESPPGLEDLPSSALFAMSEAAAPPPDLPDPATMPSQVDEFAPPSLDEMRRAGTGAPSGRANERGSRKNGRGSRK